MSGVPDGEYRVGTTNVEPGGCYMISNCPEYIDGGMSRWNVRGTVKIEDGEWNRDMSELSWDGGGEGGCGKLAGTPTSFQLKTFNYDEPVSCSGSVSTGDDGSYVISGATNWVGGGSEGEGEFSIVLVPQGE